MQSTVVALDKYVQEVPQSVRDRLEMLEKDCGKTAILNILPLDALGSLKPEVLQICKLIIPNLPGVKWAMLPSIAKGAAKTVPATAATRSTGAAEAGLPEGEPEGDAEQEDDDDAWVDPRLPGVAAGGGHKLTKAQKLSALSKDRNRARSELTIAGGEGQKHFDLSFSLHFSSTREGFNCLEGLILVPEKATTAHHHSWVEASPFVVGGMSNLSHPEQLVRNSGIAAAEARAQSKVEYVPVSKASHGARLQKDVESLRRVLVEIVSAIGSDYKALLVTVLWGGLQEWGCALLQAVSGANLGKRVFLQSFDHHEHCDVVGRVRLMEVGTELFNAKRLKIADKEPMVPMEFKAKSLAEAVAEANKSLEVCTILPNAMLKVPSDAIMAESLGVKTLDQIPDGAGFTGLLLKARDTAAKCKPLGHEANMSGSQQVAKCEVLINTDLESKFQVEAACDVADGWKLVGLRSGDEFKLGLQRGEKGATWKAGEDLAGCGPMAVHVTEEHVPDAQMPCLGG